MSVLLDTSVLVAAFTPDPHSQRAETWLDHDILFSISDWAAAEFSSAIRNKVRQGYIRADAVDSIETLFDAWTQNQGGRRPVQSSDHLVARRLVSRHEGLRAPDALHLAVAMRLGLPLGTFDERQQWAAAAEGLPAFSL